MEAVFTLDSCIRGYHVYMDVWTATLGSNLTCQNEFGNIFDPHAVAMVTASNITVGHVPRSISPLCHFFLRKIGNTIECQVTGSRRYSSDLPQGGLEIPCILKFCGKEKYISKVKKLVSDAPSISKGASEKQGGEEPPSKKLKQHENENSEKPLNEGPKSPKLMLMKKSGSELVVAL